MNMIQTVTRPVSPDELGIVSLHEHVYSGGGTRPLRGPGGSLRFPLLGSAHHHRYPRRPPPGSAQPGEHVARRRGDRSRGTGSLRRSRREDGGRQHRRRPQPGSGGPAPHRRGDRTEHHHHHRVLQAGHAPGLGEEDGRRPGGRPDGGGDRGGNRRYRHPGRLHWRVCLLRGSAAVPPRGGEDPPGGLPYPDQDRGGFHHPPFHLRCPASGHRPRSARHTWT